MQKTVLVACIIFSGLLAATHAASLNKQQRNGSKQSKLFAPDKDESNQGLGFNMTLKHVDKYKPEIAGSVKAIQIFPINTVTGNFTYNFS